jgi:hypothetical protein
LNPTRLEYLGQALRKTLCYKDASTACFSAPHSRSCTCVCVCVCVCVLCFRARARIYAVSGWALTASSIRIPLTPSSIRIPLTPSSIRFGWVELCVCLGLAEGLRVPPACSRQTHTLTLRVPPACFASSMLFLPLHACGVRHHILCLAHHMQHTNEREKKRKKEKEKGERGVCAEAVACR